MAVGLGVALAVTVAVGVGVRLAVGDNVAVAVALGGGDDLAEGVRLEVGVRLGDGVKVASKAAGSAAQPASSPAPVVNSARKKWRRVNTFVIGLRQAGTTQAADL